MTNKEKFLRENVGFHFDDLSLIRQAELELMMEEKNISLEWVLLALSKNSLENWEKWGFSLMEKDEFKREVNSLVKALARMTDDDFKKANKKKDKGIWVSEETFQYCFSKVMAQGKLFTQEEAARLNLTDYWTYSYAIKDKPWIDTIIATGQVEEEDKVAFCLAVQRVRHEQFIFNKGNGASRKEFTF